MTKRQQKMRDDLFNQLDFQLERAEELFFLEHIRDGNVLRYKSDIKIQEMAEENKEKILAIIDKLNVLLSLSITKN